MDSKKVKEERYPTGILGFDNLCEGGFIHDSVNLVVGNAGAGKTTFLLQFLYNGAKKYNQNGLYVSFEPEISDLVRAGKIQNMPDLDELDSAGRCKLLKLDSGLSIKELQEKLTKLILKYNIKRVVMDSINVYAVNLPKQISLRKQIYDLLSLMKKLNVCTIVAGESDENSASSYEVSEEIVFSKYAVDSIIELFSSGISGVGDRALRISKMRMTNHVRGPVGMNISDKGISVLKN